MEKRKGKIYIDLDLVEKDWKSAKEILDFLGFFPVRVECLWAEGLLEMVGYSEKFDEVEAGLKPPVYDVNVSYENGKITQIKLSRREE